MINAVHSKLLSSDRTHCSTNSATCCRSLEYCSVVMLHFEWFLNTVKSLPFWLLIDTVNKNRWVICWTRLVGKWWDVLDSLMMSSRWTGAFLTVKVPPKNKEYSSTFSGCLCQTSNFLSVCMWLTSVWIPYRMFWKWSPQFDMQGEHCENEKSFRIWYFVYAFW